MPVDSSGKYADLTYTSFPKSADKWEDVQDVTSGLLAKANQYRQYMEAGNFSAAQNLLSGDANLQKMRIDAMAVNQLRHAVMALERTWTENAIDSRAVEYTVALPTANWESDGNGGYTQTVEVAAVTKNTVIRAVNAVPGSDREANLAARDAVSAICEINTMDGRVQFTCYDEQPNVDLTVKILEIK